MAVNTWVGGDSGNETDYGTAANWNTTGETNRVPTDADDVIIPNVSDNCVLDSDRTINSLQIQGNGSFSMNDHDLTIAGENTSGRALDIGNNTVTFVGGTGTLIFTQGSGSTKLVGTQHIVASTELRNVQFNGAATFVMNGAMTVNGNLTITAGTLDTDSSNNYALTVAGALANDGTLTLNGSTVNLGSTSAEAGDVTGAGTFNLDTSTINFHTAGGANFIPSTSANFDTNTSTLNLIGLNGSNRAHNFTFASGNMHNITTSRGAGTDTHTDTLNGNCTITGNLTVGANSNFSTGTRVFTVNGDVDVTGQLISNGSDKPMTFKSLTIASGGTYNATSGTTEITGESSGATAQGISGFAWYNLGTFDDNDGTVTIGDGSTAIGDTHIRENRFHHLIINRDASSTNTIWRDTSGSTLTIDGDLTITKGTFFRNTVTDTLTVDGDVSVGATGKLGDGSESGANTFGGIKINSGGTYIATSGTTEVTNRFTGTSNVWKNDGGTFTHNNGTVKFTDNDHSLVKEAGSFYNFEQASSLGDYAIIWETAGGGSCTILNNLTITRGDFEIQAAGDTLDIHGQTILNGSSDTGARFNNDKNQTGTITHHGIVTINGGTYHVEDGATVNMAGIRNLGGVVD